MEDFQDLENQEEEEDNGFVALSPKGYQRILEWARFQVQICEMIHPEAEDCEDDNHDVAFLVTLAILPVMQALDISSDEGVVEVCEVCELPIEVFIFHHTENEQCKGCQRDLIGRRNDDD